MYFIDDKRVTALNSVSKRNGPVVYWMSRDQRAEDNWALLFAAKQAFDLHSSLVVVFTLVSNYPGAYLRHYNFMLMGLRELEGELAEKNISFILLPGDPVIEMLKFIKEFKPGCLVTDFDPLRIKRFWKDEILKELTIPFFEVDAHNIVPCRFVSQKEEYGAYTLRPKIQRNLSRFLTDFPNLVPQKQNPLSDFRNNWDEIERKLMVDTSVFVVNSFQPGAVAAKKVFTFFREENLDRYSVHRNDPNGNALSNVSPYLHFGQISAQRIAISLLQDQEHNENTNAFLEELIVRRELSDNFCFYNSNYDSIVGFKTWAQQSLQKHAADPRVPDYAVDTLEAGRTHDLLWNAAQFEMIKTGKMHGYMRMYWAKKILEWSSSPEIALQTAIYLNDKYMLDGRDPNGYAGCAWSIGGIHDRAWGERPVFGKIRYMNLNGCRRKFDVDAYISRINQIQMP